MSNHNPLLKGEGLPSFPEIKPEHIVPAVKELLPTLETQVQELENNLQPTWEGLVIPLNLIEERLRWTWGIIGHLMGVKNSPQLREAYEAVQPELVQFANRVAQSQPLYKGFVALRDSQQWDNLDFAQKELSNQPLKKQNCQELP